MKYDVSELIYKSISKTITPEEEEILKEWLSIPSNKELFEKIIDADAINNKISVYGKIDIDKAYKRIQPRLSVNSMSFYKQVLKYAAIFIGLFVATVYFFQRKGENNVPQSLKITEEQIILRTSDGLVKTLEDNATEELTDEDGNVLGIQNGDSLIYRDNQSTETLVYNTLIVPYGKRFKIILSDGTLVHLNAGTSLRYPVRFIEDTDRQVFLDGEAYFDVAEDKEHSFVVNANTLDVLVHGTQFNVTAYPENKTVDVALVEGSVGLYTNENKGDEVFLQPGQLGAFSKENGLVNVKKINTTFYTSWINGELVFRTLSFDEITKRLERYYNVSIVNHNKAMGKELFNASFLNQSVENVLIYFDETHNIKYTIENNQVIIN